ncbi:hypothetical protein [Kitasatospora sp. NPDC088351]|uniref:hypothetical protein n=1 Tax=Kitasatospora sp. NPDC088351 TaxID=3155180 RepID=UPI003442A5EE
MAASTSTSTTEIGTEADTSDGVTAHRRKTLRPPSKRASPALIRACQADYRKAQAEEQRRPPNPFQFAPLDWEEGAQRGRV